MNKGQQLLDQDFITKYLTEKLPAFYPKLKEINEITIKTCKKDIWKEKYRLVAKYTTTFTDDSGQKITLPIYCSASDCEDRKSVFDALNFLWQSSFSGDKYMMPRPLFYDEDFNAVLYRGLRGHHLYHFIGKKNINKVKEILPLAAQWFAKLHQIPATEQQNFNAQSSSIATVIPGSAHWLRSVQKKQPQYYEQIKNIFQTLYQREQDFFANSDKQWLIHGDAHPENIINISDTQVGAIDFGDMCLGDFARDLGAFMQQLHYMSIRHINNHDVIMEIKQLFLTEYLKATNIEMTDDLQQRIDTYYYWTMLRTSFVFLIQAQPAPDRAKPLVDELLDKLGLR
ncbi:MAG: aminoglycoside phosphotransferase family protein [Candidatus Falkowbacteria bacterium]